MNEDWLITTYDEQGRIVHQFTIESTTRELAYDEAREDSRITGEEDPRVVDWSIRNIKHKPLRINT